MDDHHATSTLHSQEAAVDLQDVAAPPRLLVPEAAAEGRSVGGRLPCEALQVDLQQVAPFVEQSLSPGSSTAPDALVVPAEDVLQRLENG